MSCGVPVRGPVSTWCLGAKVRAVLEGRFHVSHEDIRVLAPPVLRHRIKTNFNADAEGLSADAIIQQLIDIVPTVDEREGAGGKQPTVFRSSVTG